MPKLYDYLGYTFFFHTNEHRPKHVHVEKGDKQMKVEIENEQGEQKDTKGMFIVSFKKVKGFDVFSGKEKREITLLVNSYREDILKKWHRVFFLSRAITPIKINKKLKKETFFNKFFNL
jgi:hypothetical protein